MKALLRSFGFAFRGLYRAARTERNLRIHITFMVYMYGFLLLTDWFSVTRVQWALLFLANALVVAAEMLNTAIEALVDLVTEGRYHQRAAGAKDTAAGGVLACAVFAVAVGVAVLWQPVAFRKMGTYYAAHPLMIGTLAISLGIAGVFIFSGRRSAHSRAPGPSVASRNQSIAEADREPAEPMP
jgi:diacylglycerol kinase (ATP)